MKLNKSGFAIAVILVVVAGVGYTDGNGFGVSASYSTVVATHGMRSSIPTAPEVYGRFSNLFEVGVFGAYGTGTAKRFDNYRGVVGGAEIRIAPAAKLYMPYAGLGVAYGFFDYAVVLPDDHMIAGYVSIAPLRFDLEPLFSGLDRIHPIVSVLQIRLGPIYGDGGHPSWFDMGNFIAAIDLVRVGVFFESNGGEK